MKQKLLQIGTVLMALQILFVTLGISVNFHYCLEDHHMTGSFGEASVLCEHCLQHHHHAHLGTSEFEEHQKVTHFGAKCCCEDFESEIVLTDHYTFSPEKGLTVFLPFTLLNEAFHSMLDDELDSAFHFLIQEKIPYLNTGRLKTIFFSSLKLNPLVF